MLFEQRTGVPYPYARYSQIAVSDFIFGGMENTTATTQTDRTLHDATAHLDFSSDPLVSHELAHQWFGDLLTCRDWSHAWLNEGFATFFEGGLARGRPRLRRISLRRLRLGQRLSRGRCATVTGARSSATRFAIRSKSSTAIFTRKARPCCTCCAANWATRAFGGRFATTSNDNAHRNVETIDLVRADRRCDRTQRARVLRSVDLPRRPSGTRSPLRVGREAEGRDVDDRPEANDRRSASGATVSTSS